MSWGPDAQRGRQERNYSHLFGPNEHVLFSQYNAKQGIKLFGKQGKNAIRTELQQLHDHDVIWPIHANTLSSEQRRQALAYLMFVKQKHCGKSKGWGCTDGWKQLIYKTKEETSSPTMTTESVLLSCTLDAYKHHDVATCDIAGEFMQADVDELIHIRIAGFMVELLCGLDTDRYRKHVVSEWNEPVIYLALNKALYSTLQALIFWKDLTGALQEWGFTLNPYHRCVANKMVNGKQLTVIRSVQNHCSPEQVLRRTE